MNIKIVKAEPQVTPVKLTMETNLETLKALRVFLLNHPTNLNRLHEVNALYGELRLAIEEYEQCEYEENNP